MLHIGELFQIYQFSYKLGVSKGMHYFWDWTFGKNLEGVGSTIMKMMLPFRAEFLNMQHFYSFCIYSSFFLVPYRRLKNRFRLSLQVCCLSLLLFLFAFMTSWRVICNQVPKDLDQLCPCLLPRKKKVGFTDKYWSSTCHGHPEPESLFMQFFLCGRT